MHEIVNNKFLIMSLITNELSRTPGNLLEYSYDEVVYDIANGVSQFLNSSNIDRRIIASGAEPRIHMWDILSSNLAGWKDHTYIATGAYAQMLTQIKRPTSSLIVEPDRQFELVAHLNNIGSDLTFVNNECLFFFESFVRDLPSYPFSFDYTTIDQEDLTDQSIDLQFDFINLPIVEAISDNSLIEKYMSRLSSGGIMYMPYANESGRLYSEDFYVEPLTAVYETLLERNDIITFHIPSNIGFQIAIKL